MFTANSRYAALQTKKLVVASDDAEPREIRYVARRFVPPPGTNTTLLEHTVVQDERLDQITAKYLGDPTQFWRVADANLALAPEELTAEPGSKIVIALPQI